MLRRPQFIAFVVVLLLTLLLLNLPKRTAAQLKLALGGLYLPVFGAASSTEKIATKAANALVPREQLLRQLEQSRLENDQLRMQQMRLEEVIHETTHLRRMLELPNPQKWNCKLAQVVARDPANWWRTFKIDKGLRDGLTTNCPVLSPGGLVGRVSDLGFGHSQVVLLGDPDCRVAVVVEGAVRDNGYIAPTSSSPLDRTIVDLGYLSRQPKPGERVLTSGSGGIFPKGIFVGHIVDSRTVDYGLYNEARVKLAVNLNELEEVWVILP